MIKQVDTVSNTVYDSFPSLFNGLGTLQRGEYKIKIKPGAKPFALFTARHVRSPYKEKYKRSLYVWRNLGSFQKLSNHPSGAGARSVRLTVVSQDKIAILPTFLSFGTIGKIGSDEVPQSWLYFSIELWWILYHWLVAHWYGFYMQSSLNTTNGSFLKGFFV